MLSSTKFTSSTLEYFASFVQNVLEYPECISKKETNFYVFENKEESYVKNGVTKTYTRQDCSC